MISASPAPFDSGTPWPVGLFVQWGDAFLSATGLALLVIVPMVARARIGEARPAAHRAATAMVNFQLTVVLSVLFLMAAVPLLPGVYSVADYGIDSGFTPRDSAEAALVVLAVDALFCLVAAAVSAAGHPFRIPGFRFVGRDGSEQDERWLVSLAFAFGVLPGIVAPLVCQRAARTHRAKALTGVALAYNALITAVLWFIDQQQSYEGHPGWMYREHQDGRHYLLWLLPGGQQGDLTFLYYDSAIQVAWLLAAVLAVVLATLSWRRSALLWGDPEAHP
jgi:hypothetical protein